MAFPLFLIPILVGLAIQASKPLFNKRWYAKLTNEGRRIPRYGGMPSAHTAFVFSLATVTATAAGFSSVAFAIVAALVFFVLDDALRMRIFLQRYGTALRRLIKQLPAQERSSFPYLEARLGHTLPEVLVGAVAGIVLTLAFLLLFSL